MRSARTKFNVSQKIEDRTFEGITFDSALEMKFYKDVIKPQVDKDEISCEKQVKFTLQEKFKRNNKTVPSIDYVVDFVITDNQTGKQSVVDVKGMETPIFSIKKKMFWRVYPDIKLQLIGFSKIDGGFMPLDVIKQGRKARKKLKENKEKKENG